MTPPEPPAPIDPLPVALAAVSVAGQCRERSPADLALFGPGADRLVDRFSDPVQGQGLIARALTDGAAETVAQLRTTAGTGAFRVSLWRQRGGERIRLLAAFAQTGALAPAPVPVAAAAAGAALPPAVLARLGRELRGPLAAVMGFAQEIRAQPDGAGAGALAGDILAAAWRLVRLADDLGRWGQGPAAGAPQSPGEVDISRLTRRVLRQATPLAAAAGVAIDAAALPPPGAGPLVFADEAGLWSLIEALVQAALDAAGPGETLAAHLAPVGPGAPLVLRLTTPAGTAADGPALALAEALAEANSATLQVAPTDRGTELTLTFAPARWLAPI